MGPRADLMLAIALIIAGRATCGQSADRSPLITWTTKPGNQREGQLVQTFPDTDFAGRTDHNTNARGNTFLVSSSSSIDSDSGSNKNIRKKVNVSDRRNNNRDGSIGSTNTTASNVNKDDPSTSVEPALGRSNRGVPASNYRTGRALAAPSLHGKLMPPLQKKRNPSQGHVQQRQQVPLSHRQQEHPQDDEFVVQRECLFCNSSGFLEVEMSKDAVWQLGFICSPGFPHQHPPDTPCIVLFAEDVMLLFHEFYVEFQDQVSVCSRPSLWLASKSPLPCKIRTDRDPRILSTLKIGHGYYLDLTMTRGQQESAGWGGGLKGYNISYEMFSYHPDNDPLLLKHNSSLELLARQADAPLSPFHCSDSGRVRLYSSRTQPQNVWSSCQCAAGRDGDKCQYGDTCTESNKYRYCNYRGICREWQLGQHVVCDCHGYSYQNVTAELGTVGFYGGPRCQWPFNFFNYNDFSLECREQQLCQDQCHVVSPLKLTAKVYCSERLPPRPCPPGSSSSEERPALQLMVPIDSEECTRPWLEAPGHSSPDDVPALTPGPTVEPLNWTLTGHELELQCSAWPCYNYSFSWFLDSDPTPINDSTFRVYSEPASCCSSVLHIVSPELHEQGLYTCEARAGQRRHKNSVLVDGRAHRVYIQPSNVAVRQGGSARVRCLGLGRPWLWQNEFSLQWHSTPSPLLSLSHTTDVRPRRDEHMGPLHVYTEGSWEGQWGESVLYLNHLQRNTTVRCAIASGSSLSVEPYQTTCQPAPPPPSPKTKLRLMVEKAEGELAITVLPDSVAACEGTYHGSVWWPLTQVGTLSTEACPESYTGEATRWCALPTHQEKEVSTAGDRVGVGAATTQAAGLMAGGPTTHRSMSLMAANKNLDSTTVPAATSDEEDQEEQQHWHLQETGVWLEADFSRCLHQSFEQLAKTVRRMVTLYHGYQSCEHKRETVRAAATAVKSYVTTAHLPGSCDQPLQLLQTAAALPVRLAAEAPLCAHPQTVLATVAALVDSHRTLIKNVTALLSLFDSSRSQWLASTIPRNGAASAVDHTSFTIGAVKDITESIRTGTALGQDTNKSAMVSVGVRFMDDSDSSNSHDSSSSKRRALPLANVTIFKSHVLLPANFTPEVLVDLLGPLVRVDLAGGEQGAGGRLAATLQITANSSTALHGLRWELVSLSCRRRALSGSMGWTEEGCHLLTCREVPPASAGTHCWGCQCSGGGYLGLFYRHSPVMAYTVPGVQWVGHPLVAAACLVGVAVVTLALVATSCWRRPADVIITSTAITLIVMLSWNASAALVDFEQWEAHLLVQVSCLFLLLVLASLRQLQLNCLLQQPPHPLHVSPVPPLFLPLRVKLTAAVLFSGVAASTVTVWLVLRSTPHPGYPYWLPRQSTVQVVVLMLLLALAMNWLFRAASNYLLVARLLRRMDHGPHTRRLIPGVWRNTGLLLSLLLVTVASFADHQAGRSVFCVSTLLLSVVTAYCVAVEREQGVSWPCKTCSDPCAGCLLGLAGPFWKLVRNGSRATATLPYTDAQVTEVTSLPREAPMAGVVRRSSVTSNASTCPPADAEDAFDNDCETAQSDSFRLTAFTISSNRDSSDGGVSVYNYPKLRRYSTGTPLDHVYEEILVTPAPENCRYQRPSVLLKQRLQNQLCRSTLGYLDMAVTGKPKPEYENMLINGAQSSNGQYAGTNGSVVSSLSTCSLLSRSHKRYKQLMTGARITNQCRELQNLQHVNIYSTILDTSSTCPHYMPMTKHNQTRY